MVVGGIGLAVIEPREEVLVAFISHSWRDSFLPEQVAEILSMAGFDYRFDRANVHLGDELASGISQMLEDCDFVIAMLTPNSIKSLAVREELTRAHERHLRIYAVVQASETGNLPSFIRDSVYSTFADNAGIPGAIRDLVEQIKKQRPTLIGERVHHDITKMHGHIRQIPYKKDSFNDQDAMILSQAGAVVEDCQSELKSLADQSYKISISASSAFLKRCKPVFGHASRLYAVSRDDISEFWTSHSAEDAELAQEYLESNPKNTVRLFVFKDARQAHYHSHVLNIHHRYYGKTGGILVTSKETYTEMLKGWGLGRLLIDQDVDFALLSFKAKREIFYEAMLSQGSFQVRHLATDPGNGYKRLMDYFESFKDLEEGDVHPDFKVARWKFDFQNEPNAYAEYLGKLFEPQEGPAFHIVVFRGIEDREKLRHTLQMKVTKILEGLRPTDLVRRSLENYWVTEWFDPRAHEPITTGRIPVHSNEWPTALVMQFTCEQAVKSWQELVAHSALREEAHGMCSPHLEGLYVEIQELQRLRVTDSVLAAKYENIESEASEYLHRLDYRDSMTLEELVHRRAYKPPIRIMPK